MRHSSDVLLLSRMIGQDVLDPDGRALGRLADLTVTLGEHNGVSLVSRIVVHRRGQRDVLLPWVTVESNQHNQIRLMSGGAGRAVTSIDEELDADEILLVRDVLDTQIIDVAGQRVARVADVLLARRPDGRVELVGAEIGFGAVLRRLGLDALGARLPGDAVAWDDLHLTSARGHAVQLATPRSAVHLLDARGLAMLVARLGTEAAAEVLAAKEPHVAADVIRASHGGIGKRLLRALPETHVARILSAMPEHHARQWRGRLADPRVARPLLRSRVWPRRRHEPRGHIR
jgi:sporulation protein YlmC with PRC-barrel domain